MAPRRLDAHTERLVQPLRRKHAGHPDEATQADGISLDLNQFPGREPGWWSALVSRSSIGTLTFSCCLFSTRSGTSCAAIGAGTARPNFQCVTGDMVGRLGGRPGLSFLGLEGRGFGVVHELEMVGRCHREGVVWKDRE